MAPASFWWSAGVGPQFGPPSPASPPLEPLLEPLELPLLLPLELPLLEPLLEPLLLLALASLLFVAGLLLLLQAVADTPPTATVRADPKTKVRVRIFIAFMPFVRLAAPEVAPRRL